MPFDALALQVPILLLPRADVDPTRWAVIACDQYTSQPEYWHEVERLTEGKPSTLHLIFPEVYLDEADGDARIAAINGTMERYLAEGILEAQPPGFMLVERRTETGAVRTGLMVALDLEAYDYRPGSTSLIRATEGTILDRLPPRIRVREKAPIELPHIMVLIDDPEMTVIEPLADRDLPLAYDFSLMLGGGHLRGRRVSDPDAIAQVARALECLADPRRLAERYQVENRSVLLYAMGDGNHSFATAKAIWEKLKNEASDHEAIIDHPARYALVELVNVHDPGLEFEAIHRVLFNVDFDRLLRQAEDYYPRHGAGFRCEFCDDLDALPEKSRRLATDGRQLIPFIAGERCGLLVVDRPPSHLEVATLQGFLDEALVGQEKSRIDYIHGEGSVTALGKRPGNVGFYLPAICKREFFRSIILDGALPRKTFSMGDADEKRFYMECRKIAP
ncbi:DUF1015 domain-containing protein [Trichloromonas sp.]|uniref:DUF1015 domain-containing protein n=1 Tax=Trichloromonas sp. TaxID=3069249 RepID=UPI002A3B4D25|nr:DUF1015 domain-containing protein [Trichloromonas sp.]